MKIIPKELFNIEEPTNYFKGVGQEDLPTAKNILIYFRKTRENLQQNSVQNRSHHRFVLAFNVKTVGHVQINQLSHKFMPGEAILIHPYQFHHFTQLESSELEWLFCTFELEPAGLLEPLRNKVVSIAPDTQDLIIELLKLWHTGQLGQDIQAAMLRLLLSISRDRQATAADLPSEVSDNLLRKINRLLSEMRGRAMLVTDLADALSMSESRLRTVFRNLAGISLGSYLQNYRINRSMALLRTTTLSVGDIAEEAGFGSPQAFCRCFKKEIGSTPMGYRQNR